MLLHDIGKPVCKSTDEKGVDHFYGHPVVSAKLADQILRALKFDNRTRERVVRGETSNERSALLKLLSCWSTSGS